MPLPFEKGCRSFISNAVEILYDAGEKAISDAKRNKAAHRDPDIMKLVDSTMQLYDLDAIPTDKNGGFLIRGGGTRQTAVLKLLGKSWYGWNRNV